MSNYTALPNCITIALYDYPSHAVDGFCFFMGILENAVVFSITANNVFTGLLSTAREFAIYVEVTCTGILVFLRDHTSNLCVIVLHFPFVVK